MSPDYFLLPVALILLIAAAISMEKRGDSKTNSWMHTFGCWTAIIIAVWMLTWWGFHYVYNHDKLSTWIPPNEFGDMFGALTCLFSGIAIAGVIAMLRQQHEEMKETRKEFSEQTKQFEEQTKQFNEQIALARQAQKIDAFYRRLSHLRQQHEDIYYYEDKKTYKGIIAIICLHNEAFKLLKAIKKTLEKGINKEIILEDTTGVVSNFWPNVYIWAHSYFGIVQEILSENSEISTNNEFLNILANSLTPA
ncbi:MAG: hypothetical protein IJB89_02725 [Akkermansia sp.]|nr:hypothetical protein [Akkermansia sp.]